MTPFDVVVAEKFMRDNKISAMMLTQGDSIYHCWIGVTTNEFRWHAPNRVIIK